jgi:chitin disaccharide deacetylase
MFSHHEAAAMKKLIVTADDFGMSLEVNEAVEQAHREGILTCASLVVAGDAAADAVARAKRLPNLGVGLHLAIYGARAAAQGNSAVSPDGINLGYTPVSTGIAMMVTPSGRAAARREVAAQMEAYRKTGLPLGHLDGHWHCHQHPALLAMALELGKSLGLKAVRLPYEPFGFSHAVGGNRMLARLANALTHWPLSRTMKWQLKRAGARGNDRFFGKVDDGFIDERLLLGLAENLPEGVTELGLHPATITWGGDHAPPPHWQQAAELAALTSPAVRAAMSANGVSLCRWADLP